MMCQSGVSPDLGPAPCANTGAHVLAGVHLCWSHKQAWARRLERGEKIRVHPERALPLDHRCGARETADSTGSDGESMRRCSMCGQSKPAQAFYQKSRGTGLMTECKLCFNRRSTTRKRAKREPPPAVPSTRSTEGESDGGEVSPASPADEPPPRRPHRPPADGSAEQAPTPEPPRLRLVEDRDTGPRLEADLAALPVAQGGSIPTLCPHCGGRRADAQTGRCLGCGKRACSPDLAREFGHPIYDNRPTTNGGAA